MAWNEVFKKQQAEMMDYAEAYTKATKHELCYTACTETLLQRHEEKTLRTKLP